MHLLVSHIVSAVSGSTNLPVEGLHINDITYDSRSIIRSKNTLFVALTTGSRNGHQYIQHAINQGCKYILCEENEDLKYAKDVMYIRVPDTLVAYQAIAKYRRSIVNIPIIGITGSNGKTIVKEWLASVLESQYSIIKTPKSYNSQIGLPQSLIPINRKYTLGIFETGISQKGEMEILEKILKPTIGILTNIGDAHQECFSSIKDKLKEKLLLFKNVKTLIYCSNNAIVNETIKSEISPDITLISWGSSSSNTLQVLTRTQDQESKTLRYRYAGEEYTINVPTLSNIERENLLHVIATAMHLGVPIFNIQESAGSLNQLPMRLEVLQGNRGNVIINDSYTSDLQAFRYALEYLESHYPDMDKLIITSSGVKSNELSALFRSYRIDQVLYLEHTAPTSELIGKIDAIATSDTAILIKGRRIDRLESLSEHLASRYRTTTLQVHLPSLKYNLSVYRQLLNPETLVILVVKASAYGSGSIHVSRYLAQLPIDYLAVAVLDEAIELRDQGITLPLLLFNFSDYSAIGALWKYDIEPEVYSIDQLKLLSRESHSREKPLNIHLKIETGLNRLGLIPEDFTEVIDLIKSSSQLVVKSIFSHLSGSDNPTYDDFTMSQFHRYTESYTILCEGLGYRPIRHILNSAGITRHPYYQMDAVRLGLGLYGIDESGDLENTLQPVLSLKSQILQIKHIKAGESVSYSRSYMADTDRTIAIVGIGYADGLPRLAYPSGGCVYYEGKRLSYLGNICMDVCMVDITDVENIFPGDLVEIFGHNLPIQELATICNTISYEIISQVSPRVKRVYIED